MSESDAKRMRPAVDIAPRRIIKVKKKIYPSTAQYPTVDFNALIDAEKEKIENDTQAYICMRGKGSGHEESSKEMLHVLIEAESEEHAHKAEQMVRDILNDPNRLPPPVQTAVVLRQSIFGPSNRSGQSQNRAGEFTKEVRVPEHVAGGIIGKAGETVKRLQADTGTRIHINREVGAYDDGMRVITIRGPTQQSVDDCERLIHEFAANRERRVVASSGPTVGSSSTGSTGVDNRSSSTSPPPPSSGYADSHNGHHNQITEFHPVPNNRAGAIIGKHGATIKLLQQRFHVRINVPPYADAASPNLRYVEIKGDNRRDIDDCKQEIDTIIEGRFVAPGNPEDVTVPVKIPDDKAGLVIGKQGATIKSIQDRLHVRVQIPSQPDDYSQGSVGLRTALVIGKSDMVQYAIREIEAIITGELFAGAVAQAGTQASGATQGAQSSAEGDYAKQWEEYYKQLAQLPPEQQKLALEQLAELQKGMGM